jgi:hypothetical protein
MDDAQLSYLFNSSDVSLWHLLDGPDGPLPYTSAREFGRWLSRILDSYILINR